MKLRWLIFALLASSAFAQPANPPIVLVSSAPTGSCAQNLPDEQVITTGLLYSCQSGTWALIAGSGSSGFPITLGSTSIASGSTTTAVTGLAVNGVTLSTAGGVNDFLNGSGSYALPFTLTTTGTSGPATFSAGTLNVPQYASSTGLTGTAFNTAEMTGTGTTAVSTPNVVFVDQQTGADFCAKLSAAITQAHTQWGSYKGIIDARGFTTSQTCASNPLSNLLISGEAGITILMPAVAVTTTVGWASSANDVYLIGTGNGGNGGIFAGTGLTATPLITFGTSTVKVFGNRIENLRLDANSIGTGTLVLFNGAQEFSGLDHVEVKGGNSSTATGDLVSCVNCNNSLFLDTEFLSAGANNALSFSYNSGFTPPGSTNPTENNLVARITCNNTGNNSGLACINFGTTTNLSWSNLTSIHSEGFANILALASGSSATLVGADSTGTVPTTLITIASGAHATLTHISDGRSSGSCTNVVVDSNISYSALCSSFSFAGGQTLMPYYESGMAVVNNLTVKGTCTGCGGGGSTAWSALTNPSGNLALTMAADTSTFTFNATTGSSDLFKWTDTASNTGTGIMGHFATASGSTEVPWQADANGVGFQITDAGVFQSVGSSVAGTIDLAQGTAPSSAPANNVQLFVPSSVTAYGVELPGAQPTSGNTYLSCTAANPAVCSWTAGGALPTGTAIGQLPILTTVGTTYTAENGVLNLLAFGATGNGTMSGTTISGTDDTTAVQAWANACASSGLACYAPSPAHDHCYRISHIILAQSGPSGSNAGWPTYESSFEMFGDGMDVPSNLQGRIFAKTTFCSTDTTTPAIQVSNLTTNPAGSYPYGSYYLHDFNVLQVGAAAANPVIGLNQLTQHAIIERVQVDQVGTGSGIVWANLWDNSGVRDSMVFPENTSVTAGTKGIWLYNADPSESGAGQIISNGNTVGNVLAGSTVGFDRCQQWGLITNTTGLFGSADTIASGGSAQQMSGINMNGATSQGCNYEFVFGNGVISSHMDNWYSQGGNTQGVYIGQGAGNLEVSNGWTNEHTLSTTHPAEIYIDAGTLGAAAPGNGLSIHDNTFSSVAANGIYSPNMSFETGTLYQNYFAAHGAGQTCINTFNPSSWVETADACLSFSTVSTVTTVGGSSGWSVYNLNNGGTWTPSFKGYIATDSGFSINGATTVGHYLRNNGTDYVDSAIQAADVPPVTNLAGGALGSAPYQNAAATTLFIASPTTTGHTFVYAWQPSGSAIAPAALDLGTYLASPPAIGGTTAAAGSFTTLSASGTGIFSAAGAASTPGLSVTGAPYTGGNGTTNFPQLYINSGTGPTTFSTSGTTFGINAPSGFAGNFIDFHLNGGTSLFSVGSGGAMTLANNITASGTAFLNNTELISTGSYSFSSTGSSGGTKDTLMCRAGAAGTMEVENATTCTNTIAGATGKYVAAGFQSGGTTFTTNAGCSETTLVGGASIGSVHSGTTGTCTFIVTMGNSLTATNGWACKANDLTTTGDTVNQTATTTTTVTFSGTTVSGDVINFLCMAY